jgi:hypothetical protein
MIDHEPVIAEIIDNGIYVTHAAYSSPSISALHNRRNQLFAGNADMIRPFLEKLPLAGKSTYVDRVT